MTKQKLDPNHIEIREISEADIPAYWAGLDAVAKEQSYMPFFQAPPLEQTRRRVLKILEKGGIFLVALDGRNLSGWCEIKRYDFEGLDHVGQLGIGVLKNYRGQGIGTALLRKIVQMAPARGFEKVDLFVFASNVHAIHLYEQEGFEVEGRQRRARKLDGLYDDNVLMALFFDE